MRFGIFYGEKSSLFSENNITLPEVNNLQGG